MHMSKFSLSSFPLPSLLVEKLACQLFRQQGDLSSLKGKRVMFPRAHGQIKLVKLKLAKENLLLCTRLKASLYSVALVRCLTSHCSLFLGDNMSSNLSTVFLGPPTTGKSQVIESVCSIQPLIAVQEL